jgi:hypothetical protein
MLDAINVPVSHVRRALLGAALVIIIAAALRLASPEYLSPDLSLRLSGVLLGLVVAANANSVPKALPRRLPAGLNPAEEQSERRFVGWCLVLGGLGYATAWLLAPIDRANSIAGLLLAATLILSIGRVVLGRSRLSR